MDFAGRFDLALQSAEKRETGISASEIAARCVNHLPRDYPALVVKLYFRTTPRAVAVAELLPLLVDAQHLPALSFAEVEGAPFPGTEVIAEVWLCRSAVCAESAICEPAQCLSDVDLCAVEIVVRQVGARDACAGGFTPRLDACPVGDVSAGEAVERDVNGVSLILAAVGEQASVAEIYAVGVAAPSRASAEAFGGGYLEQLFQHDEHVLNRALRSSAHGERQPVDVRCIWFYVEVGGMCFTPFY